MSESRKLRIAVVGAASLIGEALIDTLKERKFPMSAFHRLDELREVGRIETDAADTPQASIGNVSDFDFEQCDFAFFCGRAEIARQYAEAAARKAWVIDSSGAFRARNDVPMISADVNADALRIGGTQGLIATPGSASIALATALAPLHRLASLERIDVATYHAVSGGGRAALEGLARDTASLLNGRALTVRNRAPQAAFNAVPQIDVIEEDGISREERRIIEECRRVLGTGDLPINVTAVRVPVFYGHSFAVHAAFARDIDPADAKERLAGAPGVSIQGDPGVNYPTAAAASASPDRVFVGRIRADLTRPRSLNLWVVADNVRKCAAFNAAAIAQILVNGHG